jgi:hypothetical protein
MVFEEHLEPSEDHGHHKTVVGCISCRIVATLLAAVLLWAGHEMEGKGAGPPPGSPQAKTHDQPLPPPPLVIAPVGAAAPDARGPGSALPAQVTIIHRGVQKSMNVRESPSTRSGDNVVGHVGRGQIARVVGSTCSAEGYVWYAVACDVHVQCSRPAAHRLVSSLQTDDPARCTPPGPG